MISLILVMVCAIAAGWLANRVHVPYPIVLVLAGIGLGFVYDWPGLESSRTLMLAIVLPAVLYPAAIDTSWRDFRVNLRPILLLAIGLVATTTLAVGIAFKWLVPEAPWAVAFALGAIVSPPDAVAATAVLRRFRLPRRIVTLLEGESLVNDATGLVLYRFAVAAALTGVFSGWALVGEFGLDRAWRDRARHRDGLDHVAVPGAPARSDARAGDVIDDSLCDLLAVRVATGVGRPRRRRRRTLPVAMDPSGSSALARLNIRTFWGAVVFVVNCLVFVLIGIRLPLIAESLLGQQALSWPRVAGLIAVLSVGRDRRAIPMDLHRDLRRALCWCRRCGVAIRPPRASRHSSAGAACAESFPWPPRSLCPPRYRPVSRFRSATS